MLSLNFFQVLIFVFLFDYIKCAKKPHERPTEEQRVKQWYEGGNTWPPTWQMETPAMKALLNHREQQILNLTFSAERWENWLQFTQQRMVPRFTQTGFKVLDIPKPQYEKLMEPVRKALEDYDSIGSEGDIDVIYTKDNLKPKFINLKKVADEVHAELTSLHEEWAGGIKLRPTSAYGVRLYQNGSSLVMHYDKVRTHVISSIVHLVHHYDDEENPWPIQIEDHDGNLHDYNLKEGQMLFYESAKCLHGRMKEFRGKYYGSIFLHYQPIDDTIWNFEHDDVISMVPPHWRDGVKMIEGRGPHYAGCCISVPDREAAGAPALKITKSDEETIPQGLEYNSLSSEL